MCPVGSSWVVGAKSRFFNIVASSSSSSSTQVFFLRAIFSFSSLLLKFENILDIFCNKPMLRKGHNSLLARAIPLTLSPPHSIAQIASLSLSLSRFSLFSLALSLSLFLNYLKHSVLFQRLHRFAHSLNLSGCDEHIFNHTLSLSHSLRPPPANVFRTKLSCSFRLFFNIKLLRVFV